MPIQIRELVIKTTVSDKKSAEAASAKVKVDKDAIIAECVDQVMDLLERQKDR
ncbi:MAG: DUF5908 family protein [Bacteroidota bacterium]